MAERKTFSTLRPDLGNANEGRHKATRLIPAFCRDFFV